MADRLETVQITGLGTSAAPQDYTVAGSQVVELLAVQATFDGSAVAGSFVPCVQIITDSGHVLGTCVAASANPGEVIEATFAPFLRSPTTGGGGSGNYTQRVLSLPTLWAYWPLQDAAAGAKAIDASPFGGFLDQEGAPTYHQAGPGGNLPYAVSFAGALEPLPVPPPPFLNDGFADTGSDLGGQAIAVGGHAPFSFGCWLNPSNAPGTVTYQPLLSKYIGSSPISGISLALSSGHIWVNRGGGGANTVVTSVGTIPDSAWSFICATYDGTDVRFYIGETFDSLAANAATVSNSGDAWLAAGVGQFNTEVFHYDGLMAGAFITGSTLTDADVAGLAGSLFA